MMKSLMESKPNLGGTSTDAEEQEQQMAAHAPSHVAAMTHPRFVQTSSCGSTASEQAQLQQRIVSLLRCRYTSCLLQ